MKKRRSDPPLGNIKRSGALLSIWAALEGDPKRLLTRLRAGVASNAEQALAADLLEKKIKPRRPRSGSNRHSRFVVVLLTRLLEGVLRDRGSLKKALTTAFPSAPPSDAEVEAARKAIPRKTVLSL